MEVVEEVMGSNDHVHIVKGKRTKRQRPSSPLAAVDMATSSGEGEGGGGGGGGTNDHQDGDGDGNRDGQNMNHSSPPTTSFTTEEEEDMANCLIMLAQGHSLDNSKQMIEDDGGAIMEKFISRRYTEAPTTTNNKAGYYVYQCKTCSRCFPSFQALGGHRASHKKPKAMVGEKRTLMLLDDDTPPSLTLHMGNRPSNYTTTTTHTTNNNNNKSKVHECSICGSEFSSGQALGGHMRRHRSSTTANMGNTIGMDTIRTTESQEPRNGLSLDLNLPAPEEDRESKFMFSSKQQPPLVFSASSLVDCHY